MCASGVTAHTFHVKGRNYGEENRKNRCQRKPRKIAISDLVGGVKFKNNNVSIISFHQFFNRVLTVEIW